MCILEFALWRPISIGAIREILDEGDHPNQNKITFVSDCTRLKAIVQSPCFTLSILMFVSNVMQVLMSLSDDS